MTGFRRGISGVDIVIDRLQALNTQRKKKISVAVFLDVKGVFDNVQHSLIVCGLSEIRLSGRLIAWIRNYVQGRTIVSTEEGGTPLQFDNHGVFQARALSLTLINVSL